MSQSDVEWYKAELDFDMIEWNFDPETHVGRIIIDRPPYNTYTTGTTAELVAGLKAFNFLDHEQEEIAVRAVIIEGRGEKAFSTGGDLKDIDESESDEERTKHDYENVVLDYSPRSFGGDMTGPIFLEHFERFPAPVIAKIRGYCLAGGLELALACDFRIASADSTLGLTESNIGLFPSAGSTQRLPKVVGKSKAKELIMTGKHIPAEEAADCGLVDYVYDPEDLEDEVADFAETLASRPPLAMRSIKSMIDLHEDVNRSAGIKIANREWARLHGTEDYEEGLASFIEDRDPEWKGRGQGWKG